MPVKNQLQNVRVLVGRARHQASALSAELRVHGAKVVEIPFIEIRKPRSYRTLDTALLNLRNYDWIILTSVNGVNAFWTRLQELGLSEKSLQHSKIAAIGPSTKNAVEDQGIRVNVMPREYVAEMVVKALQNKVSGKRVLLARAKVARDVIPNELRKAGAVVDVVEAYETVVPPGSSKRLRALLANPRRRPHVITFTSSSTVKNFFALIEKKTGVKSKRNMQLEGINFASIGPITSETLQQMGFDVHIEANKYTIPGLVQAILRAKDRIPK
ncbi:MAG TPA: uroporphyrinogen-III synthase [Terriglobales bacterium]|jgi:uroporphyrinogen-III synthase